MQSCPHLLRPAQFPRAGVVVPLCPSLLHLSPFSSLPPAGSLEVMCVTQTPQPTVTIPSMCLDDVQGLFIKLFINFSKIGRLFFKKMNCSSVHWISLICSENVVPSVPSQPLTEAGLRPSARPVPAAWGHTCAVWGRDPHVMAECAPAFGCAATWIPSGPGTGAGTGNSLAAPE